MTRGDTRLFVAILATAFVSSVTTVMLSRLLADPACERVEQKRAEPVVVVSPPPPAPTVTIEPLPEPEIASCDEVSCLLSNFENTTCCAKYDKRTKEGLDRAIITAGVAAVKRGIQACGDRSSATGIVKVSVKVMPDGTVSSVTIRQTPDEALGTCVARHMKRAEFARTKVGGSFSYPFVF